MQGREIGIGVIAGVALTIVGQMDCFSRRRKTARGEMHDDPLVYALVDRVSRYTVIGMVAVAIAAFFVKLG